MLQKRSDDSSVKFLYNVLSCARAGMDEEYTEVKPGWFSPAGSLTH